MSCHSNSSDDFPEGPSWPLEKLFKKKSGKLGEMDNAVPTTPKQSMSSMTKYYDIAVLDKSQQELPGPSNVFPIGVRVESNGSKNFQLSDQLMIGNNLQTIPKTRREVESCSSSRPLIFSQFGAKEAAGCFDSLNFDYNKLDNTLINFNSTIAPNKVPIRKTQYFLRPTPDLIELDDLSNISTTEYLDGDSEVEDLFGHYGLAKLQTNTNMPGKPGVQNNDLHQDDDDGNEEDEQQQAPDNAPRRQANYWQTILGEDKYKATFTAEEFQAWAERNGLPYKPEFDEEPQFDVGNQQTPFLRFRESYMKKIISDQTQLDDPFEMKEEHITINPYLGALLSEKHQDFLENGHVKIQEMRSKAIDDQKKKLLNEVGMTHVEYTYYPKTKRAKAVSAELAKRTQYIDKQVDVKRLRLLSKVLSQERPTITLRALLTIGSVDEAQEWLRQQQQRMKQIRENALKPQLPFGYGVAMGATAAAQNNQTIGNLNTTVNATNFINDKDLNQTGVNVTIDPNITAGTNFNAASINPVELNPLLGVSAGKLPKEASWKEDFIGAIPQPKVGQKVYEWADDIIYCLHMKGYDWPYSNSLSQRVFPYLVKLFKPRNYASVPSQHLNDFIIYLLTFDRPRKKALSLFNGVQQIKNKPSVAFNDNVAIIKGDHPDLDMNTVYFLAWSCMVSGLPKIIKLSDCGRKIGKTLDLKLLHELDEIYCDYKEAFGGNFPTSGQDVNMICGINEGNANTTSGFNAQGFSSRNTQTGGQMQQYRPNNNFNNRPNNYQGNNYRSTNFRTNNNRGGFQRRPQGNFSQNRNTSMGQRKNERIMQFPNRNDFCNNHKIYGLQARICNWPDCKFNEYLDRVSKREEEGINQKPSAPSNVKNDQALTAAINAGGKTNTRPYHFMQRMEDGHWQFATNIPNSAELFYGNGIDGQEIQDMLGAPDFQIIKKLNNGPVNNRRPGRFIKGRGKFRRNNNNADEYQFYTDENGDEYMVRNNSNFEEMSNDESSWIDKLNGGTTYFGSSCDNDQYGDEEYGYDYRMTKLSMMILVIMNNLMIITIILLHSK